MFKIGLIISSANLYQGLDAFFKEANWGTWTSVDWKEIEMMRKILEVCNYFSLLQILYSLLYWLPYLFQKALSFEKTPILYHTVVTFEGLCLLSRICRPVNMRQSSLLKQDLQNWMNIILLLY